MEKEKNYATVGAGTPLERKIEITHFVRAKFADNRIMACSKLENGSYIVSIKNPESSSRAEITSMWLTEESLIGLLSTINLFFMCKKESIHELFQKYAGEEDKIQYACSDNLEPFNPEK